MARSGLADFSSVLVSCLLVLLLATRKVFSGEESASIYSFNVTDINQNEVSFQKYEGFVLLVVNVASECGLTEANYHQLNELYSRYQKEGFRIAAFPCNQFAGQEPGNEEDIKRFLASKNVLFDVYSKVAVNGENTHPVFKWLKSKLTGILFTDAIKWNFTKFLVDCYGQPVKRFGPMHEPKDIELDILEELKKRAEMLQATSSGHNQQTVERKPLERSDHKDHLADEL